MKNLILFDDESWNSLLPLTYTKPISELRIGIFTIKEKWERLLNGKSSYITQDYLAKKYSIVIEEENFVINSRLLPNDKILHLIKNLEINEALIFKDTLVAARMNQSQFSKLINNSELDELNGMDLTNQEGVIEMIERPFDLFRLNGQEINKDFELITKNKQSKNISGSNSIIGSGKLFVEEGVNIESTILNTSKGPIYLGKDSEIMEGSLIRGPFALCNNSFVKMGTKIYGPTTIGPYSKVGGELSNVVIQGFSNKSHNGYLGNSVLGEWCNIGAGTNVSNLKNNYSEVKLWDYNENKFNKTGLQFCGLIMGDYSKTGIGTMINTGSVIGVSSNIFGTGYPRNFIPSFAWGGHHGFISYNINKSFETAEIVMARRGYNLSDNDKNILEHIYHYSSKYRAWEV